MGEVQQLLEVVVRQAQYVDELLLGEAPPLFEDLCPGDLKNLVHCDLRRRAPMSRLVLLVLNGVQANGVQVNG
jgi:hypothetical protein